MSWYDDELIMDLKSNMLNKCVKVIQNAEIYTDLIEQKFEFSGSKIDWSKTHNHYSKRSNKEYLLKDVGLFISEIKEKHSLDEVLVTYIGDNLTDYGYQFKLKDLEILLPYFLDIPQHRYFISLEGDWCFCVSFEKDLDFGFSLDRI